MNSDQKKNLSILWMINFSFLFFAVPALAELRGEMQTLIYGAAVFVFMIVVVGMHLNDYREYHS